MAPLSSSLRKSTPAAKSFEPTENALQPISLKQSLMILDVPLAISRVIPGDITSLKKNKLPASAIRTSKSLDAIPSTTNAFRARPPRGFFFQPQGSVSPLTLPVATILIDVLGNIIDDSNSNMYIDLIIYLVSFIFIYLSYFTKKIIIKRIIS